MNEAANLATGSAQDSRKSTAGWVDWPGGLRRYAYRWQPQSEVLATIGIVHGLGEHAGRYAELADHLTSVGFAVTAWDLPGHGHDPGRRGVVTNYDSLLDETGTFFRWSRGFAADRPCFLLGHSMGGNLVVNYILRQEQRPTAAIASSPMFRSPQEPRGLTKVLARMAARVFPNACLSTGFKVSDLNDDPVAQDQVSRDPLYHRRISLRLGAALIDSGRWAMEHASRLAIPLLITHANDDRLTLAEGSAQFAAAAGTNCQFHRLQNHRHETFRDLGKRPVIQMFVQFLQAQLKRSEDSRADQSV
ncbi:MAG: lysophospholipase [Pirellulaceae bacterium]|nr:lysophospholipase [Pirellulaceae bacterium]